MPYKNEHSAITKEPEQYKSFARKNIAKGIDVILGVKDGKTETQAYRFMDKVFNTEDAKKWLSDNDIKVISFEESLKSYDDNLQYDIEDVEIFRTGIHNGDKYTESDFDDMVNSFKEIGKNIKPYMKLGHDDNQGLLQKSGYPAAGWITNLKRSGNKLLANISGIPKKINDLIQKKAYGRFSPEIYWGMKDGEKKYNRVLRAVALLGGDTPACKTMDDFIDLYGDEEIVKTYIVDGNDSNADLKIYIKEEKIDMDELKKLQEQMEALKAEFDKVKSENAVLLAEKEKVYSENEVMKKTQEDLRKEKKASEVKSYFEGLVREAKIVPAQVDYFTTIAMYDDLSSKNSMKIYSEKNSDKKIEVVDAFDAVKKLMEVSPKILNYSETKSVAVDNSNELSVDEQVSKYIEDNKLEDNYENHKAALSEISGRQK